MEHHSCRVLIARERRIHRFLAIAGVFLVWFIALAPPPWQYLAAGFTSVLSLAVPVFFYHTSSSIYRRLRTLWWSDLMRLQPDEIVTPASDAPEPEAPPADPERAYAIGESHPR